MKYSDEQKFVSIVKGVQEKFPKLQGEFFSILSPTTTLKFIDNAINREFISDKIHNPFVRKYNGGR